VARSFSLVRLFSLGIVASAALSAVAVACGSTAPVVDDDSQDASSTSEASVADAARTDATFADARADGARDSSSDASSDATDSSTDASDGAIDAAVSCPICTYPGAPVSGGNVAASGLVEISGLAASRVHANVLYAHNDSGDVARIFQLGTDGSAKNVVSVTGASAVDWEDIAVGTCPTGSCVYVGDIGDNSKNRTDLMLYRMPEPALTATSVAADAYPLSYPDGAHDAETLMVDSAGAVFVLTKETIGQVQLFAFGVPGVPGTPMVGRQVAKITPPNFGFPAVTGGDFFGGPCPRMVIRTYAAVMLFEGVKGDGPGELATKSYRTLTAPLEQQGEAIAFAADGKSLFTASEGASVPVYRFGCGL
jgi:hypothetical protein